MKLLHRLINFLQLPLFTPLLDSELSGLRDSQSRWWLFPGRRGLCPRTVAELNTGNLCRWQWPSPVSASSALCPCPRNVAALGPGSLRCSEATRFGVARSYLWQEWTPLRRVTPSPSCRAGTPLGLLLRAIPWVSGCHDVPRAEHRDSGCMSDSPLSSPAQPLPE